MIDGLVSVVMPLYNAELTVGESIESVLAQTYKNWELLVVDDGSTDMGPQLVRELALVDQRIRLIEVGRNSGVVAARNRGIQEACGEYLAFLDSDDLWEADKLERQLVFAEHKEALFVYGECKVMSSHGQLMGLVRRVPVTLDFKRALRGNSIPCLTVLLNRKKISEQFPDVELMFPDIPHEDYALWLSLLRAGIHAYGMQEPLGIYRAARGSLSGNKVKAAMWTYRIYRNYLELGRMQSMHFFFCYVLNAIRKRI